MSYVTGTDGLIGSSDDSVRVIKSSARASIVVKDIFKVGPIQSINVKLPDMITVLRESIAVSGHVVDDTSNSSVDVNAPKLYDSVSGADISGENKYKSILGLSTSKVGETPALHSIDTGSEVESSSGQSADVVAGDSFLILADIVSEGLGSGITSDDAENNIQIINKGSATVWALWVTYGGYVLLTDDLGASPTAAQVKDAITGLANIPNPESVIVTGASGGPYTVEFTGDMGGRFISPLLIQTTAIDAIVTTSQAGTSIGSFNDTSVNAYFKINDVDIPIKSFDFQEPTAKLGALLNVTLAIPDVGQAPVGSSVDFGLTFDGVPFPLIDSGKFSGRNYRMNYQGGQNGGPRDEVTIGTIDIIADKFTLAPRRPVIMFDPLKVLFNKVELNPRDAILDEFGQKILPVYEPVAGLTMKQVLGRAYTNRGGYGMMTTLDDRLRDSGISSLINDGTTDQQGLGFTNVITNVKDYPMKQANFDDQGWHSGAQGCIGMYNPDYIPLGDLLMVLSSDYPLPVGQIPRVVPLALPTNFNQTIPFKNDTNAVLLTYQISASEDPDEALFVVTESDPPEIDKAGEWGQPGYSETSTVITYLRKKRRVTLEVVAQVIDRIVVERRSNINDSFKLVSRETTNNTYSNDLKVGHHRTVESLCLVAKDMELIGDSFPTVLDETCEIFWIDDPTTPGQKVQSRSFTRTTGLVYEREESSDVNGTTYYQRHPITLAQESGVLLIDFEADALGQISTMLFETTEETLRHVQGNQYEVIVTRIDHLNEQMKQSISAPRTGDTGNNPYDTRSHTMRFRDYDSEAEIGPRIPASINAGELPPDRAFELARLFLQRVKNPLNQFDMTLAKVDIGVVRGTVIIGQTRYGYTTPHIVLGRGIRGENLGQKGHQITMTLEARELPTVVAT